MNTKLTLGLRKILIHLHYLLKGEIEMFNEALFNQVTSNYFT